MIIVFGDMLADLCLQVSEFPLNAGDLHRTEFVELGPGGSANVAIMLARLGRPVAAMGEVGDDEVGGIVRRGLEAEGVDVRSLTVTAGGRTPLACVLVDQHGEPAYAGYPGQLHIGQILDAWDPHLLEAEAVFCDGWAEHPGAARMAVDVLRRAKMRSAATFFDPGPGNPSLDNGWHRQALAAAQVVLVNEQEGQRLTGQADAHRAAAALLKSGPDLVVVKRGRLGCLLRRADETQESPGFRVRAVDTTGAGDSVAAAVIDGHLRRLPLAELGILANATGAAKVQKRGTGRQMPTRAEVRSVLVGAGHDADRILGPGG
jgi:sugar/nucleoside kinase (ribokinase family)